MWPRRKHRSVPPFRVLRPPSPKGNATGQIQCAITPHFMPGLARGILNLGHYNCQIRNRSVQLRGTCFAPALNHIFDRSPIPPHRDVQTRRKRIVSTHPSSFKTLRHRSPERTPPAFSVRKCAVHQIYNLKGIDHYHLQRTHLELQTKPEVEGPPKPYTPWSVYTAASAE